MQISFEVYPPRKPEDTPWLHEAILGLSVLSPEFISVTFGAVNSMTRACLIKSLAQLIVSILGGWCYELGVSQEIPTGMLGSFPSQGQGRNNLCSLAFRSASMATVHAGRIDL